ncbi:hypothetical protein J6524_34505 [Bradyrhizobium sp. WSM 1738]|uniref:hypothetical protein n=1 Tax=Bradyrhizobium hereditatis TaxID=2821405 RepID=UPI001CE2359B|nr:hypothetical protein [Bradyrhizobium hereditatis]MCA6119948.1 hypothetical protein [Bradyrhizobium hereditatis]
MSLDDPRSVLLGAQNRHSAEEATEEAATESQAALQEIWLAEIKKDALAAFDAFVEPWGVKYDKAIERGCQEGCVSRFLRT